jgi:hypothetical protein
MKVGWDVAFMLPFLVKKDCEIRRHRCREVATFDAGVDGLYDRIRDRFSFLVLKDHQFLNWRLAERPDKTYTRYVLEDDNVLKGYVALKEYQGGGRRKAHILDLQAEDEGTLHELMAAAESFAHGRDELSLWTNPRDPYSHLLREKGFEVRESQDRLIVHTNYGEKETMQEGAWWFCLADNDVY